MIKKITFLLTICLVSINSYSAEGAFNLLNVEARDIDKGSGGGQGDSVGKQTSMDYEATANVWQHINSTASV